MLLHKLLRDIVSYTSRADFPHSRLSVGGHALMCHIRQSPRLSLQSLLCLHQLYIQLPNRMLQPLSFFNELRECHDVFILLLLLLLVIVVLLLLLLLVAVRLLLCLLLLLLPTPRPHLDARRILIPLSLERVSLLLECDIAVIQVNNTCDIHVRFT